MPDANAMTVGVMALVAQHEREAISQRTKAALAAAKVRGTKLGGRREGAADISAYTGEATAARSAKADERVAVIADDLRRLRGAGLSLAAMAARLNTESIQAPRGGRWTPTTVSRALKRLGA
jgi:DNA invertase Pin-like site-specific DNA recombinase